MIEYSEVVAQNKLDEIIDRVIKGEAVLIARDGRPVVEVKAILGSLPAPAPSGSESQ
jgi:antitoxin (DNA-binding transcriptional repressor) of toxin-antitoxin stability system